MLCLGQWWQVGDSTYGTYLFTKWIIIQTDNINVPGRKPYSYSKKYWKMEITANQGTSGSSWTLTSLHIMNAKGEPTFLNWCTCKLQWWNQRCEIKCALSSWPFKFETDRKQRCTVAFVQVLCNSYSWLPTLPPFMVCRQGLQVNPKKCADIFLCSVTVSSSLLTPNVSFDCPWIWGAIQLQGLSALIKLLTFPCLTCAGGSAVYWLAGKLSNSESNDE